MNPLHIIIATERRVSTPEKPRGLALADAHGQLMSVGTALNAPTDANILYASEWDQVSPWIIPHKGDIATVTHFIAGWPRVTEAQWEAANPAVQIG